MRNSLFAGLCLGLLLTLGLSFGAYFYITAQNRGTNAALADEIADMPAAAPAPNPTPPTLPTPVVHLDPAGPPASGPDPAPKPSSGAKTKPEPAARAEVKPGRVIKLPVNGETEKLVREKLSEPGLEASEIFFEPTDPADLVDFEATVSGTVVDDFGIVVAGAGVYADVMEKRSRASGMSITYISSWGGADDLNRVATTDAQGNFTFIVSRKVNKDSTVNVSVTARATGFAGAEAVRKELKNGDALSGMVVKLRTPGTVAGIVSTPDGQPIAGATVTLMRSGAVTMTTDDDDDIVFLDLGGVESDDFSVTSIGLSNDKLRAVTDAGGAFRIEGVPEGEYEFHIRAPGFRATWENTGTKTGVPKTSVKPGQVNVADSPLHMAPVTSLRAVVRSNDGNPVSARVTAELFFRSGDNAGKLAKQSHATTEKDGTVLFGNLPSGEFDVVFAVAGFEPSAKTVVNLRDAATTDIAAVFLNKKSDAAANPDSSEQGIRIYTSPLPPDKR